MRFLAMANSVHVFCLVAMLAGASGVPLVDFDEHVNRMIRSAETDGYDIATVHAVHTDANMETRQTRRDIEAHADSSIDKRTYSLQLSSGVELRMSVQRRSIDITGATFTELTEEGHRETIPINPSQCFFSGELDNGEGFASLSLCDGDLVGSVTTSHRDYEIHTLPHSADQKADSWDRYMQVLVTWRDADPGSVENLDNGLEIPEDSELSSSLDEGDEGGISRRSVSDQRGTIEICDVVDSYYIGNLRKRLGITNSSKILELLISKWSSAAYMLSNRTQVGWDLNLRLVRVELWRSHPDFYKTQPMERLGSRLDEICPTTQDWRCDQISLHTGRVRDVGVMGLSWVGGLCNRRTRCAAIRAANRDYMTELHELGHSLGLKHDRDSNECIHGTDPVPGFMGGNKYHFRECYKEVLARKLPKKSCIFSNAFNISDIFMDFSHN